MINKSNLWFLTLFSLILVLGVYYVTIPSNILDKVKIKDKKRITEKINTENSLSALRVSLEETRKDTAKKLEEQLTNAEVSTTEKNNIYEQLKYLNEVQGREEKIEKQLKEELKIDCFTKINNSDVEVVCISKEQNKHLANTIMRTIQNGNTNKLNITIKFQSK